MTRLKGTGRATYMLKELAANKNAVACHLLETKFDGEISLWFDFTSWYRAAETMSAPEKCHPAEEGDSEGSFNGSVDFEIYDEDGLPPPLDDRQALLNSIDMVDAEARALQKAEWEKDE